MNLVQWVVMCVFVSMTLTSLESEKAVFFILLYSGIISVQLWSLKNTDIETGSQKACMTKLNARGCTDIKILSDKSIY